MADLTFGCPHCKQTIACDEQWSGHEIQCPLCQGTLAVPAAESKKHSNPLVPKPPSGKEPKLGLGQKPGPAPTGNRNIPIRDLAGPAQKKQSPVVGILCGAGLIIALGVGGYFGYGWYKAKEAKKEQAAAEQKQAEAAAAAAQQAAAAAAAAATNLPPPKPAIWTLDLAQAKIPEGQVNGKISGTNFVAESVRIDPVGTAHVVRFLQGQPVSPDREVLVYLHLKPGEKIGGQSVSISSDMKGSAVPQVAKRWKTNPRYAATLKSYLFGYAMKLEFGKPAEDGSVSGKVFLALPDPEQTVVAGVFKTSVTQVDPNAQPVQTQAPTPAGTVNPDAAAAMQRRYGIRR